ncbi:zinc-ribbon domain-containing protein [Alkalihalobacillus sp. R86527]|uniref:TcaA NTF2-like domain-containing protein n=1 Tax=Alkalihalobacillus sp. R86527 TaxID=3093863 RepID=UPI00366CA93A
MSFCTECGQPLKENNAFCTECGSPQGESKEQNPEAVEVKKERQPLSRKKKISLLASGITIACLIIAHFVITSMTDPMNKVKAMDRAISEEETEAFFDEVNLDQSALINKDHYLQYIKESGWEEIRLQLIAMEEADYAFDTTIRDSNGNQVFIVKKKALIPGVYYTYAFDAIPNEVLVSSNVEEATITIGKQSSDAKEVGEEMSFGKAYPGEFDVSGTASNPFGKFTYEDTVELMTHGNEPISIPIEFSGFMLSYDTNVPESTLFIDGKSTKKTLSEFDALGPFPDDKNVVMHAEWKDSDGEVHKTDDINQYEDNWGTLEFEFAIDEDAVVASTLEKVGEDTVENSDSAEDHVLNFRQAYENALNSRDYSIISPFLLSKSPADKELKKYIGDLQDKGYSYEFTDNTVTATEDLGEGMYSVSTNEIFVFTNHLNEQIHYDREKTYYLSKEEDGLKITKIVIKDTDRNDL